jgi:hypothetical protein
MDVKRFSALILFYSLLLSLAFAQNANDFNSLIGGLVSVIFIVIFVIILLILGGVIKKPSGRGIPGFLILFIALIIVLFVIPMFVPYPQYLEVPANFKIVPLPSYVAQVFVMLGLPEEWMYMPAIIYLFILPFAAIYTLVWAFLQSLGIFTNVPSSVNRILAFVVAFLTIPFGWFVKLVWVLFSFMGAWSVVIFVATFVIGVFFRGFGVARKEYVQALKTYENVGKELQSKLNELQKRVDELSSEDIEREVNRLSEKYGGIYPKIKDLAAQVLQAPDVSNKRKVVKEFKLQ